MRIFIHLVLRTSPCYVGQLKRLIKLTITKWFSGLNRLDWQKTHTRSFDLFKAYVLFLSVTLTLSEVEFTRGDKKKKKKIILLFSQHDVKQLNLLCSD